jgi:hypothetical protein
MKKLSYLIVLIIILGLIVSGCIPVVPPTEQNESNDKAKPTCTTIQSGNLVDSTGNAITTGYDEWGYNYQALMFNGRYCDSDRVTGGDYCDVNLIMKWNDAWLSNKSCDGDNLLDRHYGFSSYIGSGAWLTNHQSGIYRSLVGDWILEFDYLGGKYVHDMTITDDLFNGTGTNGVITWTVTVEVIGNSVKMTIKYDPPSVYYVDVHGIIAEDGTMSGTWENLSQSGTWKSTTGAAISCDWNYFVKIVAVPKDATLVGGVWHTADGTEIGPSIWGEFATIQEVSNDPCAGLHGVQYKSPAGPGLGQYGPE